MIPGTGARVESAPPTPCTQHPTPNTPDPLLDRIAAQVVRRGMVTPAVFFLEMNRPVGFLAGQATHVLTPFLAALIGLETVRKLAHLLEDPANVDRLLERIEQLERERRSES
jgi:2-polyprenyl-6-methoxyphenol hydroxylase-like FAD-dependent oxidoreductase